MFIISILGDFNLVSTTLPLCLCKHFAGFTSGVMCHLQWITCFAVHYRMGAGGSFPSRLICMLEVSTLPHTFAPITPMTWDMSRYIRCSVAWSKWYYNCDRILENHPYWHILHIKYLVLKSSLKILFFLHLCFQYSKNALNYKEKCRNI